MGMITTAESPIETQASSPFRSILGGYCMDCHLVLIRSGVSRSVHGLTVLVVIPRLERLDTQLSEPIGSHEAEQVSERRKADCRAGLSVPEGVVCFGGLFLEERTDDYGGALPAREYLPAREFEGGVFGV